MTEVEYIGNVKVDMEWAEQFVMKSKKLAMEYEIVKKKQFGKVFLFILKRKDMKYEYAIARLSVVDDGSEKLALINVMMLDKRMIKEISDVVFGGEGNA